MLELHPDTIRDLEYDVQERQRINERINIRLTEAARAAGYDPDRFQEDGRWKLDLEEGLLLPASDKSDPTNK